jgi:alkylation response protein AidB-like acyl-CoA dehydrogenase
MHRTMCVTNRDRDCRLGMAGCCARCPYKAAQEAWEATLDDWLLKIAYHGATIADVPERDEHGFSPRQAVQELIHRANGVGRWCPTCNRVGVKVTTEVPEDRDRIRERLQKGDDVSA